VEGKLSKLTLENNDKYFEVLSEIKKILIVIRNKFESHFNNDDFFQPHVAK